MGKGADVSAPGRVPSEAAALAAVSVQTALSIASFFVG